MLAVEIIITLLNHADICLYIYLLFIFDDTFLKRCLKLTVCQYGKGYVWYRDNISKEGVQFSLVSQSCPTLCDPMDCSMPGLPVHHQHPEFTQTHVHWVSDAIQPSHPLSFPSPPALNLSQHQGLFQWISSSHQVAKVLEFQLQHQSFQWTPRTDLLWDGLVGSPCIPRDSQESSPTLQFKSINSLALTFLYTPALTSIHDHWKNHSQIAIAGEKFVLLKGFQILL